MKDLCYLDLFAGAGGLSEGFMRAGFLPIAHIEIDRAACYTLKTRQAFKWLQVNHKAHIYEDYILGKLDRDSFYSNIPLELLSSVLNCEISEENLTKIFDKVNKLLGDRKIAVIVGGPPCQAYSLVGRSRDKNKMLGDKRNYLYQLYAKFLNQYEPEYFVFENVTGLLSAKDIDGELHFVKMKKLFKDYGYSTEFKVLSASKYGVLQNRKRIILIGKRGDSKGFYPHISQIHVNCLVNEVFKDLPRLNAGKGSNVATPTLDYQGSYLYESKIKTRSNNLVTFHCARPHTDIDLMIYKIAVKLWNEGHARLNYSDLPEDLQTHKNINSFIDRFKVVEGDMPYSHTVVAHISRDGHYYIHPDIEQNRSLTPREAARLQTFPDDFYFESVSGKPSRTAAFKQIGNAVPVLMAEQIAKAIKKMII